jgi:AraC-like DNA-binding protein
MALLQADDLRDSFRGRTHTIRHDDGREYWTFTAALPLPDLARYVNSYWEVDGALAHVREKVLPTADIVLIFNLGDVQHLVARDDQSSETAFPNAFVSGLQEHFLITASHHRSWLCGMRLTPFGAYKLFRTPLTGVANRVLHLEDLRGSASLRFADTLRNAASPVARFAMFDAFLRERIAAAPEPAPEVMWAWDRLIATNGAARILDIADDIGWSRKHLRNRFLEQIGLAPKTVGRIMRFHTAIEAIGTANRMNWATLAADCGYADQAHFNRDFRDFAGAAPETYLKARIPDSEVGFMRLDEDR